MPKVKVYDMSGKSVGELDLAESVFGIEPNKSILHAAVTNYLANQRSGTQSTKTRTEVRGGGRKPWKQKGTGNARQGSIRSPQWTGGGVALGPKPRDYSYSMNKKAKQLAFKSALSSKVSSDDFLVLDSLQVETYSTKTITAMLEAMEAHKSVMIITLESDEKVVRSARNIPKVKTAPVNSINIYDIIRHDKLIVTKEAAQKLEEVYAQ